MEQYYARGIIAGYSIGNTAGTIESHKFGAVTNLGASVELVAPLIGAGSGRTRVICSHDPGGGLAEADIVLGLRAGRPALLRRAAEVEAAEILELYR